MKRTIFLLSLLAGARAAAGQSACVSLTNANGVLTSVARYFLDDDLQAVREGIIVKVDSSAPRLILTDAHKCQQIMRQVTSVLRSAGDWQAFQASGYQFAVYQIGTYYAVVIRQNDQAGSTRIARVPMLVFRTSDVGYLGTILV